MGEFDDASVWWFGGVGRLSQAQREEAVVAGRWHRGKTIFGLANKKHRMLRTMEQAVFRFTF
ncbi:MAG: hypothetical protein ONB43_00335 [candidate division KSB1 bacterium]|nr:hypothetical protein [candidate division KSB1 bacterium]MDZ7405029.1 hypothetical protein [candidate division KSB1 bacterium]